MSEIHKRCSKVPRYEGGIITICNIDRGRKDMGLSDICDTHILNEVRYEIETTTNFYLILFI